MLPPKGLTDTTSLRVARPYSAWSPLPGPASPPLSGLAEPAQPWQPCLAVILTGSWGDNRVTASRVLAGPGPA